MKDGDSRSRDPSPTAGISTKPFAIPKNRSASSLSEHTLLTRYASAPSHWGTPLDTSGGGEQPTLARSPTLLEHEHGQAVSGLHRIRQQVPTRQHSSHNVPSRSSSLILSTIPVPAGGFSTGPSSPLLTASEDLMRFPAESLHSFSFAQKSDDFLQMRYNVLKRSMDMLKDKGLWAAGGLGIANAQAKISGDQEVQSMMDLLNKVNVLGGESGLVNEFRLPVGALTGPAQISGDNPFEESFSFQSGNQKSSEPGAIAPESDATADEPDERIQAAPALSVDVVPEAARRSSDTMPAAPALAVYKPRGTFRRTYTDIASLSLQSKLTDALSQPFLADENTFLSPTTISSAESNPFSNTQPPAFQSHGYGRATPTSQAIFTTDIQSPWTISAANDLACLAIGVQRSEIRKLSILDVVREDKRQWLEAKLKAARETPTLSRKTSPTPTRTLAVGNGVTARLLSKPPARETGQGRRTKTDEGSGSSTSNRSATPKSPPPTPSLQSRGVLLCGDVVPILKRNGDSGSASLWVQEKRDKLIWVMEEIAEDIAYLSVDEVGCITKVSGKSEAVWGMERVRRGMDVTRLIPDIPRLINTNTGALDYEKIAQLRRFTARTANDISIPITVDQLHDEATFRVSSFPHIAGMMVLSAPNLFISSSNTVVSEALFGRSPNGLSINELIPGFDKMLDLLVEEDHVALVEGIVIPEHSFRRARAMLALRDGKADAAAVFLRPNGLPALHRDGAEIMVDIQMRVVKSETVAQPFSDAILEERPGDEEAAFSPTMSRSPAIVYALWITYSRSLHAVNHGVGPISPLISRPSTPPHQPVPGGSVAAHIDDSESDDGRPGSRSSTTSISSTGLKSGQPRSVVTVTPAAPPATDSPKSTDTEPVKKQISDFVILEEMGAGAYGQVKLARPKATPGKKVVIKYVTKRRILVDTWTRDRRLGTVPLEIHVLDYLRRDGYKHPNIVEMVDFFEDDTNYYILMKPHGLPGMDLFDYIELRVNMSEAECRRIFRQVASAVEFLHVKAKVVHRDIKDENVILDGEGRIKLIDFGSASYIKNGPFDVFVGTIDYAAPEVLSGASYDGLAQDIWALGILLYTILYKENPFYSIDEIMDHDLRVPYVVSEESIDLVRGMLERDVSRRLKIGEVVGHAWLQAGKDEDSLEIAASGSENL